MGDLADALREAGHEDVADALERKELAGRLRQTGRGDLADALEAGGQNTPAEDAEPSAEPAPLAPHEQLAQSLHDAQSRWVTLGVPGGSDGEAAKAYVAERQAQDQLVVAVPGATPRADGPPPHILGRAGSRTWSVPSRRYPSVSLQSPAGGDWTSPSSRTRSAGARGCAASGS